MRMDKLEKYLLITTVTVIAMLGGCGTDRSVKNIYSDSEIVMEESKDTENGRCAESAGKRKYTGK